MFKFLKNLFHKPQAQALVKETIEEYQRMLFTEENRAAYHAKLAEYYRESIGRMSKLKLVQ